MRSRAAPIAARNSASTSRAGACPPNCGRVRATPTRASSNQSATVAGQADRRTTGAAGTFSPVACRQRSRTRSSSARAVAPSTISVASWHGRCSAPRGLRRRGSSGRCSGRSQRPAERSMPPQNASPPSITTIFSCWQPPAGWWLSNSKRSRFAVVNCRRGRNSRSSVNSTVQSQTRIRIVSSRRARTSSVRNRLSGVAAPPGSRLISLRMSQPTMNTLRRAWRSACSSAAK